MPSSKPRTVLIILYPPDGELTAEQASFTRTHESSYTRCHSAATSKLQGSIMLGIQAYPFALSSSLSCRASHLRRRFTEKIYPKEMGKSKNLTPIGR